MNKSSSNPYLPKVRTRKVKNHKEADQNNCSQEDNKGNKLRITNKKTRYRLNYGSQFKPLLEARDQVLQHPFYFEYDLSDQTLFKLDEELMDSRLYDEIIKNMKKFLVESLSNVVSSGFKFLLDSNLEEKESAEYTAKNVMINSQAIYRETISAISSKTVLRERTDMDKLRMDLILVMDNILENILINLADSYPQASPSGGTPRMREAINEVNRVQDDQNDFIFTSGVKISDFMQESTDKDKAHLLEPQEDGNYTKFIMQVINTAISVTQQSQQDFRKMTVFQKFREFNEQLFWVTQQEKYQEVLHSVDKQKQLKQSTNQKQRRQGIKDLIANKFDLIASNKKVEELDAQKAVDRKFSQMWGQVEDGVADLKKNKKFLLGKKIPAAVKAFKRQEIQKNQFEARHSSILRILTKWAGYLEEVFKKAEKMVKQRKYPFRTIFNELFDLSKTNIQNSGAKLMKQLNDEHKEVKRKFNDLLIENYEAMGKFLSQVQPQEFISSVSRFTETRTSSSKINAVLATLMLKYTNILIHHLLRAGQRIVVDNNEEHNLNLIVFRVSDLMRSKLQCSESGFISLLKTMYILDNNESMKGKFKLVRIKNKLDDPANNIMINYLFMEKVQCELQLSIQEAKGKEKSYYIFSHLVYELTRGMFGSIAECAVMISQLDPMITASNGTYYKQKKKQSNLYKQRDKLREKVLGTTKQKLKQNAQHSFFQCSKCKNLITKQSFNDLFPHKSKQMCFRCMVCDKYPENNLKNEIKRILAPVQKKFVTNYGGLEVNSTQKCLIELTSSGKIKMNSIIDFPEQMKTYSIEITEHLLKDLEGTGVDYQKLDYVEISKEIMMSSNPKAAFTFAYLFEKAQDIPDKVLELIKVQRDQLNKISVLLKDFKDYRQQKSIIKAIKYKSEIIQAPGTMAQVLDRVCQNLVLKQNMEDGRAKLKYTKYKHLELFNVEQLSMPFASLTKIPKWLKQCRKLSKLELKRNNIKEIKEEQLPPSLTYINLEQNSLTSIDISELPNLTYLSLKKNKIQSLDIDDNDNLNYLNLEYNQLTRFSIGDNKSLTKLYLTGNILTSFNIGINNSLKALRLNINNLESVELRGNSSIKQFYCSNNHDLRPISYLPSSIQVLIIDQKQAISFDFKTLVNLKKVTVRVGQVSRNEMTNLGEKVQLKCQNTRPL